MSKRVAVIGVWPGLVARVPSLFLTTGCTPVPGAAGGSDISMHNFRAGRINCQKGHLGWRGGRFNSSKSGHNKKIFKHT